MLRPETERLWNALRVEPVLAGFVLIGGTALAMHPGHRLSEDLDLVCLSPRLPRGRLEALIRHLLEQGHSVEPIDNPGAAEEFEVAGMDLRDYQQDFLVNGGVKVRFFTADEQAARLLDPGTSPEVRVASVAEIFDLKSLLSADRSKARDWFDLYTLMSAHGFDFADFHRAFVKAGSISKFDRAANRLCSGQPQKDDEGFEALISDPPSIETMGAFFRREREAHEIAAARAAKEHR